MFESAAVLLTRIADQVVVLLQSITNYPAVTLVMVAHNFSRNKSLDPATGRNSHQSCTSVGLCHPWPLAERNWCGAIRRIGRIRGRIAVSGDGRSGTIGSTCHA
ncbi:predicted protein [Plenodomus lingam JN3]|uniref:Predicted protein n=1 Tax=Leptosphaeria maculans (strain JN3 / isolate v23.1.3 / race Av1-4-5-6-7-8) TaxID=985895 RepID=E4ZR40_LEPMJ|nr:predicted protein [Plenodomus lingam JN3]CBX93705.1 predicted protein [Plenodomus lingam JN3]